MATPASKTTESEKHPPTFGRDMQSVSQTKTHLHTQRKSSLPLSLSLFLSHTHTVVRHLSAFDLLQLQDPFSFENNTACCNKERNAAPKGQGWELIEESKLGAYETLNKARLVPTKPAQIELGDIEF